jgi:hypothetical protein
LRAQKNAEDESYDIAFNNLRSEVIKLRNEALEKDKILLTLVDKMRTKLPQRPRLKPKNAKLKIFRNS